MVFPKLYLLEICWSPGFLRLLILFIISLTFFKNFIEISKVFQKIGFSPSILIFINFSDILTFPCYIKLYWYYIGSSWNMKGGVKMNPPAILREKSTLKKPSLIRVQISPFIEEITVQVRVVFWSCFSPHPVFCFLSHLGSHKISPF